MSDTTATPVAPAETAPAADPAPAPVADPAPAEAKGGKEELPAWAQKELTDARSEAAKYRVRAQEAEKKLAPPEVEAPAEEKAPESNNEAAVTAAVESANLRVTKIEAAIEAGIEGKDAIRAFADLLQGSNAEEIQAHAEKVSTLFGATKKSRATDPSQGASGTAKPDVKPGLGRLGFAYSKNSDSK